MNKWLWIKVWPGLTPGTAATVRGEGPGPVPIFHGFNKSDPRKGVCFKKTGGGRFGLCWKRRHAVRSPVARFFLCPKISQNSWGRSGCEWWMTAGL